jgi:hypothetical protein
VVAVSFVIVSAYKAIDGRLVGRRRFEEYRIGRSKLRYHELLKAVQVFSVETRFRS